MNQDTFKVELEAMAIPELIQLLKGIGDELSSREVHGVAESVWAAEGHLRDAFTGFWIRTAKAYPVPAPAAPPRVGQGEEGVE
jgi:hypothetical protein